MQEEQVVREEHVSRINYGGTMPLAREDVQTFAGGTFAMPADPLSPFPKQAPDQSGEKYGLPTPERVAKNEAAEAARFAAKKAEDAKEEPKAPGKLKPFKKKAE